MFDGGSIFLYGTTVIMYMYSVLPNLFEKFASIPLHSAKDAFPRSLRSPTLDLASNHPYLQRGAHWRLDSPSGPMVGRTLRRR
ncbi:hypothetical protein L210DRAFT_3583930 [Boletus edulis BED1]|uniref:Uncharacterized protein n=1 Tax=Boletus edulis BED1 TaxID=1328754 RepID=A0AAD4BAM5_BOLED|nr:hypothetical protein L210DRAFT_3583930 [Boletus edulis BED1]